MMSFLSFTIILTSKKAVNLIFLLIDIEMKKIKKIRLSILLTGIFGASIYIFTNTYILKTFVISVLSRDQRTFIKKKLKIHQKINQKLH